MMHPRARDQELYLQWRAFARTAQGLMVEGLDDFDEGDIYELVPEWQPRLRGPSDPWWIRQRRRKPWLWPLISEIESDLQGLSEYHSTLKALRANEVVGPQLGNLVGTVMGQSRLAEDELIEGLLQEMALRLGHVGYDEEAFQQAYLHIEGALYAENLTFKMVAPMFQTQFARLPLVLGDQMKVDEMSFGELNAAASAGLLVRSVTPDQDKHVFNHRDALMYSYSLPKKVTPATQDEDENDSKKDHAEVTRIFDMTEAVVSDVMRALRLVHHGAFSIPGAVHLPLTWFDEGEEPRTDFLQAGARHYLMTATFSDKACSEVESVYKAMGEERIKRHPGLGQAIRRFSFAAEKHRPEDRLLDMMIAAEALFLSDVGTAQDKGELRYRMSLRAAFFLGKEGPTEREIIFRFMKRAYDARSSVAHGGVPTQLRDPQGEKTDLETFTRYLERYMRHAINQAIREAPDQGPFLDWDKRILSGDSL